MTVKVILSPRAEKQLKALSKVDQVAVARKIRLIRGEKASVKPEKLQGYRNIYRVRVGRYRIVYRLTREQVYVVLIGHRRDIYQVVRRLLG